MTKAELQASGKNGYYSPEHDSYFFEGETPPPLKKTEKAAVVVNAPAPKTTPKEGLKENV